MNSRRILTLVILFAIFAVVLLSNNSIAEELQIPTWVKNNAKWWAEGQIGDDDFVKGIQYMIDSKIMKIPQTTSETVSSLHIPIWIKNNAGWWADGQISDNDFVKGIQYLIQKGVMKIKTEHVMVLSSSVFDNNGTIPSKYTCDGKNVSPPLTINGVPKNTHSLVLIVDDPDAPRGTVTHWTVWNIPPQKTQFLEGEKINFPQGITIFGTTGYGGPCPPSGTHRYFFKLYALDSILELGEGSTKENLIQSMNAHIIEQVTLIGKYSGNSS